MMAHLEWYFDPLSPHQLNKIKKNKNLDPDKTFWIRTWKELRETRIVRESDYSPASVPCKQLKARVSQDIEWQHNSNINEGP